MPFAHSTSPTCGVRSSSTRTRVTATGCSRSPTRRAGSTSLREIRGVVGKEISKHRTKKQRKHGNGVRPGCDALLEIDERDRHDYFTCTSRLFTDYCQSVVRRYGLEGVVKQNAVTSIEYDFFGDSGEKLFKLSGCGGPTYARAVVVAVGPGRWPGAPVRLGSIETEAACHSSQLARMDFPPARLKTKIKIRQETNLLIVGGGLTSAQVADMAIKRGVSRVWLLMRGEYKGRHSCSSPCHSDTRSEAFRRRLDLGGKVPERGQIGILPGRRRPR